MQKKIIRLKKSNQIKSMSKVVYQNQHLSRQYFFMVKNEHRCGFFIKNLERTFRDHSKVVDSGNKSPPQSKLRKRKSWRKEEQFIELLFFQTDHSSVMYI